MDNAAARRVCVLHKQFNPDTPAEIEMCRTVTVNNGETSSSHASVDGRPSSYARVHGDVSRAPAVWQSIKTVAKEHLEDVKYEKAQGEGIAKVGAQSHPGMSRLSCCHLHTYHSALECT